MFIPADAYLNGDKELRKAKANVVLTPQEAQWIALEKAKCEADIVYFAEHYFQIVAMDSRGQHVIKMYPKQRDLLRFYQNNNRCVVLASRQVGKTTTYAIYVLWCMIFQPNFWVKILANKGDTAGEIAEKVALGYRMLPFWLKPGVTTFNQKKIVFENGSRVTAHTTSPSSARGGSAKLLIFDELAFLNPPSIANKVWASAYPVVSSSKETKVIIVSTPQGTGNLYYTLYMMAKSNKADELGIKWKLFEFKWNEVPGRDERWKQQQIEAVGIETWNQEFDLLFSAGSNTLIEPDFILKQREEQIKREAEWMEKNQDDDSNYWETIPLKLIPGASWNRFEQYDMKHTYLIGVDTADGVGQNWSVAKVFDITDCFNIKEVAVFRNNKISPTDFAYVIAFLGYEYGKAVVAIENNNMGSTVIDFLEKVFNYDNIFRMTGKKAGICATSQTKQQACIWFRMWTNLYLEGKINMVLHSSNFLDELERFVRKGEGDSTQYKGDKISDDEVMATIWLFWILQTENAYQLWDVKTENIRHVEIPRWCRIVKTFDKYLQEVEKDKISAILVKLGGTVSPQAELALTELKQYGKISNPGALEEYRKHVHTEWTDEGELIPVVTEEDLLVPGERRIGDAMTGFLDRN